MKRHWLIVLIAATAASWIVNVAYYQSQRLERPLYLNHYYDMKESELYGMSLYYIQNKDTGSRPYQFELPNGQLWLVDSDSTRETYGRYELKEAFIRPFVDMQLAAPLAVREVKAHYSNGDKENVWLGDITIYPDDDAGANSVMESSFSRSTSANLEDQSSMGYTVLEDTTVTGISYSFAELLGDTVSGSFAGADLTATEPYPMSFKAGDTLNTTLAVRFAEHDIRRFDAYRIRMAYTDGQGQERGLNSLSAQPRLYAKDLREYVSMRKEEGKL